MSYLRIVRDVIDDSDVVLQILDSRLIELTRNGDLEDFIARKGKKLIYVLNKCDLVPSAYLEKKKKELQPCVFVSAKKRFGVTMLLHKIYSVAGSNNGHSMIRVGVIGYPNVGKSSIINALKGKSSAGVSPRAGFTKGKMNVKISARIIVIDTPGVIPIEERDPAKLALLGAKNADQLKYPDVVALGVLDFIHQTYGRDVFVQIFGVEPTSDDLLHDIAVYKKKLLKGGIADIHNMSKKIIQDWQRGMDFGQTQ
jgi:ribosome biogenesis GTPase A